MALPKIDRRAFLSLSGLALINWQIPVSQAQTGKAKHLILYHCPGAFDGHSILQPENFAERPGYRFQNAYQFNNSPPLEGAFPLTREWLLNPVAIQLLALWQKKHLTFLPLSPQPNSPEVFRPEDFRPEDFRPEDFGLKDGLPVNTTMPNPKGTQATHVNKWPLPEWSERLYELNNIAYYQALPANTSFLLNPYEVITGLQQKIAGVYEMYGLQQQMHGEKLWPLSNGLMAGTGIIKRLADQMALAQGHSISIINLPGINQAGRPFVKQQQDRDAAMLASLFLHSKTVLARHWESAMVCFLPAYGLAATQEIGKNAVPSAPSLAVLAGGGIKGGRIVPSTLSQGNDGRHIIAALMVDFMGISETDVYGRIFPELSPTAQTFSMV